MAKPEVGRWVYCKYCYKNVCPEVDYLENLVRCSECGAGLAPLDGVIKAGSYEKWYDKITLTFYRRNRYLDQIEKGLREPTGEDEYGVIPGICPICKRRMVNVYWIKADRLFQLCDVCEKEMKGKVDAHGKD